MQNPIRLSEYRRGTASAIYAGSSPVLWDVGVGKGAKDACGDDKACKLVIPER